MGGSWENYIDLSFGVRRMETNPTLVYKSAPNVSIIVANVWRAV